MADLESDLRRHYGSQQLPADRARAILAAGHAMAARRAARRRWILIGTAAAAALVFGGAAFLREQRPRVSEAAAAVVAHFAPADYTIAEMSPDRAVLERWLREQGGPAAIEVPVAMRGLQPFGCQVLGARGQKVFLICFFLDSVPLAPGEMPIKKEMVVTAADGTMMKKNRALVHLVVAPRAAFRDAPVAGARVQPVAGEGWSFEAWTRGDLVYLAGSTVPADKLAELTRAL